MFRVPRVLPVTICCSLLAAGSTLLSGCAPWPVVVAASYMGAAVIADNIHFEQSYCVSLKEALAAADLCTRALAGDDLFRRGFARAGGWDIQTDTYVFTDTFEMGRLDKVQIIIPVEVSQDGLARVNVSDSSGARFDFGSDPTAWRLVVGPHEAAYIALDAGLREVQGPLRVSPACDVSCRSLVWRVACRVVEGGYDDTVVIDSGTGLVLQRSRVYTGRSLPGIRRDL